MRYYKNHRVNVLDTTEYFQTTFRPIKTIRTRFITLYSNGQMVIEVGYAWDGVSGPVKDRAGNLHASLLHDAIYQLMRMELLSHRAWRVADQEYKAQLKKHGYNGLLICIHMAGLSYAGGKFAKPGSVPKIIYTI